MGQAFKLLLLAVGEACFPWGETRMLSPKGEMGAGRAELMLICNPWVLLLDPPPKTNGLLSILYRVRLAKGPRTTLILLKLLSNNFQTPVAPQNLI